MFRLCEYHFGDDPTVGPTVAYVREGTGYLDRANDLETLADLCEQHPDAIKADQRNYRATDVADARRVAAALYRALGDERDGSAHWMQSQSGLWPLLLQTWAEVQRAGRFLAPLGQGEALFPSLVSASARPRAEGLAPREDRARRADPADHLSIARPAATARWSFPGPSKMISRRPGDPLRTQRVKGS